MGLLDKLKGATPDHPALDAESAAGKRVASIEQSLSTLADQAGKQLELVPADDGEVDYVFIGKPPKKFGFAWIKDGQINNLTTLVEEQGIPDLVFDYTLKKLRKAYEGAADVERFNTTIGEATVVVTPSPALERTVREALDKIPA